MNRHVVTICAAGVFLVSAVPALATAAPESAPAPGCANVHLVYARGTDDPPGLGPVGSDFHRLLRERLPDTVSMTVHPVDYPATQQWATAVEGVSDVRDNVLSVVTACPDTQIVLGGYSQGAAVAGFVTADHFPDGVDPATVPPLLPPEVADHVAAVVLFGPPNNRAMDFLHQPMVDVGAAYTVKTREYCATEDPVCSEGFNFGAHSSPNYTESGLTGSAAQYAAGALGYPGTAPPVLEDIPHLEGSPAAPGPSLDR